MSAICLLDASIFKHPEIYIRLTTIHSIKSLIQEQANAPTEIDPRRTILIQRRVIPQQRQEISNDEKEARQGNQIRRHPHGKALDNDIGVEGFEHIAGEQRVVYSGVLVLLEVGQLLLSDVYHFCDWDSLMLSSLRCCAMQVIEVQRLQRGEKHGFDCPGVRTAIS